MRILFTFMACLFSVWVSAQPINKIVVFGDSLSDNGNLYHYMKEEFPQDPPFYKGRFSNGPVWIELLTELYFPKKSNQTLNPVLQNYAFGGAGISDDHSDSALFTLEKEVDSYFLANGDKADENALYVVWIGANNYLALPDDREHTINTVMRGIHRQLQRLVDKGAKSIMIVNLPDLGKSPAAFSFDATELLSQYAMEHNHALSKQLSDFKSIYPDIKWIFFNVDDLFNDAFQGKYQDYFGRGEGISIEKTTGTCYDIRANEEGNEMSMMKIASRIKPLRTGIQDPCTGYLFFDTVHPTTMGHRILADLCKKMLDAEGVQFASVS